ncbi:MAG: energy transducer TonB [Patescibacteria group bacterium]
MIRGDPGNSVIPELAVPEQPGIITGFKATFKEFWRSRSLRVEEKKDERARERKKQVLSAKALSVVMHTLVIVLVLTLPAFFSKKEDAKKIEVARVDIDPYKGIVFPISMKKAGGGGGGGDRSKLKPSRGKLPKKSLSQLTPPTTKAKNLNPQLTAEPTIVLPPKIDAPSPPLPDYGDPQAIATPPSDGTGSGGGIGTGSGGGVGSGTGPGLGPGSGGGSGGGAYKIGGGVSAPVCIYCPDPEYTEEARKGRHMGVVVLWTIIDENGRVKEVRVQKTLGMGLDEAAARAVTNWRFKPAERNGKPVPVYMTIEVTFHLY